MEPIAVLGAGAWGTALAILLSRNGQSVRLWDVNTAHLQKMQTDRSAFGSVFPDTLSIETQLESAVKNINDIFLVVPSFAFRDVLQQLKKIVSPSARFAWGTKGLDPETQQCLHTVVFDVFSNRTPVAALSGPSFAKEVGQNIPTAVSLAGNNADFLESLSKRFNGNHFRVYISLDFIGVQLCAVVKNVIAIAVGMVDGLGFGTNTKCALITRGLHEMANLCEALGGKRETVLSLAGVGDLILTCTDNQSRNRRFGLNIGKGLSAENALKEIGESVEGYYNAKQLHHLIQKHSVSMPIAEQVFRVLYEHASADCVLSEFLI